DECKVHAALASHGPGGEQQGKSRNRQADLFAQYPDEHQQVAVLHQDGNDVVQLIPQFLTKKYRFMNLDQRFKACTFRPGRNESLSSCRWRQTSILTHGSNRVEEQKS